MMPQQTIFDMLGKKIVCNYPPKRIVSLVPSQTELLYDLGLKDSISGQTKFCIHPKEFFGNANKVGGTKKVDFNKIIALNPDLIICNKEENTKEIVETLEEKFPVWTSDIVTIEENNKMIELLGKITQTEVKAAKIITGINQSFKIKQIFKGRCLYFIWKKPYMAAANDTFINTLLNCSGYVNVLENTARYPALEESEIIALNPDTVFLSSEPYPFKEKHIEELQHILPKAKIRLVDGEMFSWYGSRILHSWQYFSEL